MNFADFHAEARMRIRASRVKGEASTKGESMKIPACAAFLVLLGASSAQAQYASVVIRGEVKPGVYGRVEFGNAPPPVVVYPQPVVIVQQSRPLQPIYLHVPPGHAKKWDKHCHKYNACNRPVYFVKSEEYGPDWDDHHDHKKHNKGKGKG
jgi:hypothetical protein